MSFKDRDTTASREVTTKPRGVVIRHRETDEGAPVAIFVEFIEDGVSVNKPVPQEIVDSNWPGGQRTLKDHLFSLIDAAKANGE